MGLPGLAQLSNTTSTFSGQLAAACEFNLPENVLLEYQPANWLLGEDGFDLTANISPVTLHISPAVVINEPLPYASAITASMAITGTDFFGSTKLMREAKLLT